MNKNTHGGKRDGSGAKPGPLGTKTPLTVKLSPVVHEFFATLAESRGKFIERNVLASKDFRTWRKQSSGNLLESHD